MRGAPIPPADYDGEHLDTDEKLEQAGWAAGLDVWEQVGKGYSEWYLKDDTLGNAQLWSLQEAIKAHARRGDAVEMWIERARNRMVGPGPEDAAWRALNDLLNDYRGHADSGVPLYHEVQGPNAT